MARMYTLHVPFPYFYFLIYFTYFKLNFTLPIWYVLHIMETDTCPGTNWPDWPIGSNAQNSLILSNYVVY